MLSRWMRVLVILGSMAVVGFTGTAVGRGLLQDSSTVTPPAWGSAIASTSGNTMVFSVEADNGNDPFGTEFDFSCDQTTGGLTCTNVSPLGAFLDPGQSTNVTVTYSTSSQTGTGSIRLESKAVGGASNYGTGYITVDPAVTVTSKSVPSSVMQYAEDDTATFDVKNETGSSKTYTFTCEWGGASCTAPSSTSIGGGATKTVSVAFDAGDIPATFALKLTATSGGDSASDEEDVTVTDHLSVNATAERTPVYAEPNVVHTDTFEVRFAGQTAETFTMGVSCPGGGTEVRSCSVVGGTSKSVGDTPVAVAIQYTAGANGDTSTIELTATRASDGDVAVTGELDVVSTSDILLTVDDANYGPELNRSECVNISAGAGAIVCDDFQYVYPLTPAMRMNKSRQIGLLYNGGQRGLAVMVGANLVLPPGVTEPDSIKATLVMNGTTVGTQSYPASAYAPGENTRIAFDWWCCSIPSGANYPEFNITLQPWTGQTPETSVSVTGNTIVMRHDRRFGRGWWIAGLERLKVRGDTLILTAGDASGRVYLKSGSKWVSQGRARPDTIVTSGSNYVRELLGGGEVHFSSGGDHTKTVDRNGNETLFSHTTYNGYARLTSIRAPLPTGTDTIYKLSYNTSDGRLQSIDVRSASGGWDTHTVHASWQSWTSHIDSIIAPDGRKTSFATSYGKINSVYGPAGDTTHIQYGHRKVEKVTVKTADVADVVIDYRAASRIGRGTSGWTAPAPVEEVFSRFDGPLAGDTTAFYVTAWGAVRGIRDALGNETWIDREDEDFPGLPTRVRYPNGREVESVYQSDGLLDYTLDRSTGGLTDYAWKESVARPDTIVSPEGVKTVFTYDSDGNRLTEKVVGGQATTYTYDSDGLLVRVKDGLAHRDTLVYDSLGNLASYLDPEDAETTYERDYLGRVTETVQPIDGADELTKTMTYDVMGRVTHEYTFSNVDSMWTEVQTTYDSVGRRVTVQAFGDTVAADSDSLTTGVNQWWYDDLGRVIKEQSGDKTDSLVYDLAGNVTAIHTERGHVVTMEYDVLGRLTKRVIPEVSYQSTFASVDTIPHPAYSSGGFTIEKDSVLHTYDAMGNVLTIDNRFAQITRTYQPDGLLASESQAIKNYGSSVFTNLVYDIAYAYDRDGRRVSIEHPSELSGGTDRTVYTYDALGRVSAIDGPLGDNYAYTYNDDQQVTSRTFPGSGETTWDYDDAHRLTDHTIRVGTDTVRENSLTYRDNGTIATVSGDDTRTNTYGGLGPVAGSSGLGWENDFTYEEFTQDPFGAQLRSVSIGGEIGVDSVVHAKTVDTFGRMTYSEQEWNNKDYPLTPSGWEGGWTQAIDYDASGNKRFSNGETFVFVHDTVGQSLPVRHKVVTHRTESKGFYSADQRLMGYQVNRDSIVHDTIPPVGIDDVVAGAWGAYEEYWYDGLGRRVLKVTKQEDPQCEIAARCHSSVERFIWDGNQILWETKQDDQGNLKDPAKGTYGGTIGYIHGGDIDAPIAMMRGGSVVVLHQSWRGLYAFSTDEDGDFTTCTPEPEAYCAQVPWPAGNGATFFGFNRKNTPYWYGSLVLDQQDATGLSYRRNRYYDPETGQFTQTDPIGIAGGLNTYGYANGDPINFSDPFGLSPCDELWNPDVGDAEFFEMAKAWQACREQERAAEAQESARAAVETAEFYERAECAVAVIDVGAAGMSDGIFYYTGFKALSAAYQAVTGPLWRVGIGLRASDLDGVTARRMAGSGATAVAGEGGGGVNPLAPRVFSAATQAMESCSR